MNKGFLIDLGVSTLNFVAENLKPTFTTHSQHSGRWEVYSVNNLLYHCHEYDVTVVILNLENF